MKRKRYSVEQVIGKLREAEVILSQGRTVKEVSRELGVTEQTYYRWRKEYGGLKISQAKRLSAPAQLNIPRDMWTQVVDIELPEPIKFEHSPGGTNSVAEAAALLSNAKNPVILNGAGVVLSKGGIAASLRTTENLTDGASKKCFSSFLPAFMLERKSSKS